MKAETHLDYSQAGALVMTILEAWFKCYRSPMDNKNNCRVMLTGL